MDTAIINIKVQADLKVQIQEVAQELGLTISALVHGFLKNLVRTRTVTFGLSEEPSEYLKQTLAEAIAEVKAGKVVSFADSKKALGYLDKMITDERKHRKN